MATSIKPVSPNAIFPTSLAGTSLDSFAAMGGSPRPGISTDCGHVFPWNDQVIDPNTGILMVREARRSGLKQSAHQATQNVCGAHS